MEDGGLQATIDDIYRRHKLPCEIKIAEIDPVVGTRYCLVMILPIYFKYIDESEEEKGNGIFYLRLLHSDLSEERFPSHTWVLDFEEARNPRQSIAANGRVSRELLDEIQQIYWTETLSFFKSNMLLIFISSKQN
ncbi:hypothetical protein AVEN_241182-1 [Araneus ventricosus]|uniref:Uncharacterized protein n=1 Tax=Araneus ventricosus TaxID=182803 RepID=A0A4Y2G102_ARAVE|nr:hypothetical protein AVEN_241182-1 [Araneus ventricosus]